MLGEKFTLDIRPTFVDELDRTVAHIERKLRNPEATDLDGRPRVKKVIRGKGRVDMGCYESDYRPIGLMLLIR